MKKSSIKYFGVTAAALLAVSPIAAQTVSSSQGNTVAAATTDTTTNQADQAKKVINNLNATGTVSSNSLQVSDFVNAFNPVKTGYNQGLKGGNDIVKAMVNSYWSLPDDKDDANVTYQIGQVDGWSAQDTFNTVQSNTQNNNNYPVVFTVKAVDSNNNVIASKNVTLTFSGVKSSSVNIGTTFTTAVAKVGDSTSAFNLGYAAVKDLKVTDASGNVIAPQAISATLTAGKLTDDSNNKPTSKFTQYGTATQNVVYTIPSIKNGNGTYSAPSKINGLDITPNQELTLSDGSKITQQSFDQTKDTTVQYSITRNVQVYNGSADYQPFFSLDSNSVVLSNNAVAPVDAIDLSSTVDQTTATLANKFNQTFNFNYGNDARSANAATAQDIKNAIQAAGGSVDDGGKITNLSGVYYITVTLYSPINNKPATVTVPVNFTAKTSSDSVNKPVFTGLDEKTVLQGQSFNPYDNVTAYDNGSTDSVTKKNNAPQIMSGYWTVQNPVNPNVPGEYKVVYSVVNSQGLTTTKERKIIVQAVNGMGTDKVVNFVPGYGVMVWSATDNAVNATSDFVQHGTTVKTFDTKTVDGVSYTRINKANSNQWVQSKYFDANANNNTNTNTDSNQETPFEGTLTIKYVPGYRVFLRDGQANMQQQSVGDGEAYKVWAKKTVGNHTYYRIGTDAQWIEDTYAQF